MSPRYIYSVFLSSLSKLCQQLKQHYATSRFPYALLYLCLTSCNFLSVISTSRMQPCFQLSLHSTYSSSDVYLVTGEKKKKHGTHKFICKLTKPATSRGINRARRLIIRAKEIYEHRESQFYLFQFSRRNASHAFTFL